MIRDDGMFEQDKFRGADSSQGREFMTMRELEETSKMLQTKVWKLDDLKRLPSHDLVKGKGRGRDYYHALTLEVWDELLLKDEGTKKALARKGIHSPQKLFEELDMFHSQPYREW